MSAAIPISVGATGGTAFGPTEARAFLVMEFNEAFPVNLLDPSTWMADPRIPLAFALGVGLGVTIAAAYTRRRRAPLAAFLESGGQEEVKTFLQMNPEERFDLEALNSIDLRALAKEVVGEKRLLHEVMQRVDGFLHRVRSETEEPALAGAILRNKTLDWYLRSPSDPGWAERMALRWGGIFHESRVPGGRLSPKLSVRLVSLRLECAKASGLVGVLLRILLLVKSLRSLISRRSLRKLISGSFRLGTKQPLEPPLAQVCQAYLDDLAASGRQGDRPFGLERLSELARRVGSPEVNRTLGELFPRDGTRPVVVLDARFHPGIHDVMVTAPPPRAVGEATYELVHAEASPPRESAAGEEATSEGSMTSPWGREGITKDDWGGLLDVLQKRKARLDPPPVENYRNLESYLRLRELILADSSACKAFLVVHWKGKPSGLALLAKLLSEGTFVPEAETDGDYLEAELGHVEKGNPDSRPKDGRWDLGSERTVVREIAEGNVRAYRIERGALDPRKAAVRTS